MIIGEIVERLIRIKESHELLSFEYEAVLAACNLLDRLPRMEDANTYEP